MCFLFFSFCPLVVFIVCRVEMRYVEQPVQFLHRCAFRTTVRQTTEHSPSTETKSVVVHQHAV